MNRPDQESLYLLHIGVKGLRRRIHEGLASFPSQIPIFEKHDRPDMQHKMVQLYFIRGLGCPFIAKRYGLATDRTLQIIKAWRDRAILLGYVQSIPPEDSARSGTHSH